MTTDQILLDMYMETRISLIRIMRAGHNVFPLLCLFKAYIPPKKIEEFKQKVFVELIMQEIGWTT